MNAKTKAQNPSHVKIVAFIINKTPAQPNKALAQSNKTPAQSNKALAQSNKTPAQSNKTQAQSNKTTAQSNKTQVQSNKTQAQSNQFPNFQIQTTPKQKNYDQAQRH